MIEDFMAGVRHRATTVFGSSCSRAGSSADACRVQNYTLLQLHKPN